MISLNDIDKYCTSQKVKQYAHYCLDKLKQNEESTYAFVYAGYSGMQFEDENENRYLELNIEQKDEYVDIRVFIVWYDEDDHWDSIRCKKIDKAINKWNELF